MTDTREIERLDSEVRYIREAIDEFRQTLTRVVTLLEGTEKLRDRLSELERENATMKERIKQQEERSATLTSEWSSLKTKALWLIVAGGALAGAAGSGASEGLKSLVSP